MSVELLKQIEEAIGRAVDQVRVGDSTKAQHFSQASLNLSHTLCNVATIKMQMASMKEAQSVLTASPVDPPQASKDSKKTS